MTVAVQVVFDRPQREIATLLRIRLSRCASASLVAGFMTVEGIDAIAAPLRTDPGKLVHLVVGAGTWRAFDALNDVYYGKLSPRSAQVMSEVVETLRTAGAEVVRANIPTAGWIGGPGTAMAVLNRNPESRTRYDPAYSSIVFVYEIKRGLNAYLSEWASETPIRTMADVIAFNDAHADRALRFGQDLFLASEATRGDLAEPEYRSARAMDLRSAAALGLDAYMDAHRLDAVLFAGRTGAAIAAKAGYPSVQVPAGFTAGLNGKDTPDYPLGATFTGRAWSEPTLLRLAYAFEQTSQARRLPPGYAA